MSQNISVPEVDEVQVTLVMDNSIDVLMAGSDEVKRYQLKANQFERLQSMGTWFLRADSPQKGNKDGTVLFDTGVSRRGILNNLDATRTQCIGHSSRRNRNATISSSFQKDWVVLFT